MTTLKNFFSSAGRELVKLGKALMLPMAVLPIAGLLLRLGQADIIEIVAAHGFSAPLVPIITALGAAGNAVFSNLAVIFALGVAIGFAKENHGAAALAAYVGYVILTSSLKVLNADLDMGVFGGIIVGITAGLLYNRYNNIRLPSYLAFFGGRRFVPIVTGASCFLIAVLAYFIWPAVSAVISGLGNWLISSGNIGLFFYGIANRLLIPLGLHHILNSLVWFQFGDFTTIQNGVQVVVQGDLHRFFAHDPTAGAFMAGFFPIMMFGLPAAAMAMLKTAHPARKKASVGLLVSLAFTSFLTGITEPIEFSFMFLAFPLYVIHAVLTGLSLVIMNVLGVKLGFTFSAGLFDYVLSFKFGTNGAYLIPVGLVYAAMYYFLFVWVINKWDLKTPGREEDAPAPVTEVQPSVQNAQTAAEDNSRAAQYVRALGGKENIKTVDACATRLRLEVQDAEKVDTAALKAMGVRGVVKGAGGSVQVVIGPEADLISDEIKEN